MAAAPNSSLSLQAEGWAYLPAGDEAADVQAPADRYGACIVHPRWWAEPLDARHAAAAVVASRELAARPPGDESYWRPRFETLRAALAQKLTYEAKRGTRSHEGVGSGAFGVPHGWLVEPRWH